MKTLWITTETTGLNPNTDHLLKVMFAVEIDKKIQEYSFDYGIRPPALVAREYLSKDYAIFTPEEIASEAFEPSDVVYKKIIEIFGVFVDKFEKSDKFTIAGHSTHFAVDFLRQFFKANGDDYFGSWFTAEPMDVKQLAVTVEYYLQKKMFPNYKLDTLYDCLPASLKSVSVFPNQNFPSKLVKIKTVHNALMMYLNDIPF